MLFRSAESADEPDALRLRIEFNAEILSVLPDSATQERAAITTDAKQALSRLDAIGSGCLVPERIRVSF